MDAVACTIVAKPNLALARVIADSFRAQHPEIPFVVALTDAVEGRFDPRRERFELLEFATLDVPGSAALRFRYPQQQLSYAATPFVLEALLDRGARRVLFFKQESLVTGSHADTLALLDHAAIALTPHLLTPLEGQDAVERELDVLLAGSYNLGFLGIAERPSTRAFLRWWQARLREHCVHAVADGMHFEQRWIDLVPGMFDGVHVIRDAGANIGHWSLPERRLAWEGDVPLVDGRPCRLLRFSGYDVDRPDAVTRYNDRLGTDVSPAVAQAFATYREALAASGHEEARCWPYAYARFDNGVALPDEVRALHAALGPEAERFGDPFRTAGAGSFWSWLTGPDDELPGITRLWAWLLRKRADVQAAYPRAGDADRQGFHGWATTTGRHEHGIPDAFPVLAA